MTAEQGRWFPVCRVEELVPRHVAQTQLFGQEIALWRDDAGRVNAWENRCPHRGVRLSIGHNIGTDLICQYHGWRFESVTARCAHIPADPARPPPAAIRANPYSAAEQDGYVWTALTAPDEPPPSLAEPVLTLRSVHVRSGVEPVAAALREHYRFAAHPDEGDTAAVQAEVRRLDPFTFAAQAGEARVLLRLQPMRPDRTLVHASLLAAAVEAERLTLLRHHAARLAQVRDAAEAA